MLLIFSGIEKTKIVSIYNKLKYGKEEMVLTIPLDKETTNIYIKSSQPSSSINAMQVSSEQSLHFTGRLPSGLYPFVYGGKSESKRLWHGQLLGSNTIETKGSGNEVDGIIFDVCDVRLLLVPQHLVERALTELYTEDKFIQYSQYNAYELTNESLATFLKIHTAVLNNEEVSEMSLMTCLFELLKNPVTQESMVDNRYALLRQAIAIMNQHIKDPISITVLANQLDIGVRNLELVFQKYLTISPKSYYKRLLLSYVEIALRNKGGHSVSNVLEEFQIYNLSQFGASFKKNFDTTPSQSFSMKNKNNPFGWDEKVFLEFL